MHDLIQTLYAINKIFGSGLSDFQPTVSKIYGGDRLDKSRRVFLQQQEIERPKYLARRSSKGQVDL